STGTVALVPFQSTSVILPPSTCSFTKYCQPDFGSSLPMAKYRPSWNLPSAAGASAEALAELFSAAGALLAGFAVLASFLAPHPARSPSSKALHSRMDAFFMLNDLQIIKLYILKCEPF